MARKTNEERNEEWTLNLSPARHKRQRGRAELVDPRILNTHEKQILGNGRKQAWVMDIKTFETLYVLSKIKDIGLHADNEFAEVMDGYQDAIEASTGLRRQLREQFAREELNYIGNVMLETMGIGIEKLQEELERSGDLAKFMTPQRRNFIQRLLLGAGEDGGDGY